MRTGSARVAAATAALAGTALLAACGGGGGPTGAPIACPTPSIPADAADLTRHRPGAAVRDLTTLEFDARMTGLQGGCRVARGGTAVEMQLTPGFSVDRGAGAQGRAVELPWSVAVVDARTSEPLGRPQRFLDTVTFGPNETRTTGTGQGVTIALPVSEGRTVRDYRVLVFFQLSPEELAANRRRGPR